MGTPKLSEDMATWNGGPLYRFIVISVSRNHYDFITAICDFYPLMGERTQVNPHFTFLKSHSMQYQVCYQVHMTGTTRYFNYFGSIVVTIHLEYLMSK